MRVLLLHEMSGVHTNLAIGLRELGVEVDLACYGDGFKSYKTEISLGDLSGGLVSHFDRVFKQCKLLSRINEYDVVQVISPSPFYSGLRKLLDNWLIHSKPKLIYVAAGSDSIYRKHVRELNYHPPHNWNERIKSYETLQYQLKKFDAIVPVCWEYKYSMERAGFKTEELIPFPIAIENNIFYENDNKKKLKFYHPLNRTNLSFDFKGTLIIKDAFNILRSKYGHIADFVIKGNMTHGEYSEFIKDVDVLVDQLYSYSYGMSAAISLKQGQIVISGQEPITKERCYYKESPVINAKPNVNELVEIIENILTNKNKINILKQKSINYAINNHSSLYVAEKYLELYNRLLV